MTGVQISSNVAIGAVMPALEETLPQWSDSAIINATVAAINALPIEQRREAIAAILEQVGVQNG